jgi:hypothetical protein
MYQVSFPKNNILSKITIVMALTTSVSTIFSGAAFGQTTAFSRRGQLEANDNRMSSDNSPYDFHFFNGTSGQEVTIDLYSTDFDTYLILLDASSGNILAQNDDESEGSTDSSLSITLPQSGGYIIMTGAYDRSGRGSYWFKWSVSEVDNSVTQFQSSDSICNTAFAQFQKNLLEGRELTIPYQSEMEMEADQNYPEGRPFIYQLDIKGEARDAVLDSPQFLMSISRGFLNTCTSAGAVTISRNDGNDADRNITFGLVDGQVTRFRCLSEDSYSGLWGTTSSCSR